jgi:hypothetical protein
MDARQEREAERREWLATFMILDVTARSRRGNSGVSSRL